MAKYGRKASEKVKKAMHERKRGTLKSGRSRKKSRAENKPLPLGCRRLAAPAEKFRARRPRRNSCLGPDQIQGTRIPILLIVNRPRLLDH